MVMISLKVRGVKLFNKLLSSTSLVGTPKIFAAAKKISGAGFKFSKASAETMASNLKVNITDIYLDMVLKCVKTSRRHIKRYYTAK